MNAPAPLPRLRARARLTAAGLRRRLGRFAQDTRGGPALEFVLVLAPLAGLLIFAFQVALGYFFTLAALDAAERTARIAATLPIAHCSALRNPDGERLHQLDTETMALMPSTPRARACMNDPSPCLPVEGTWTCRMADTLDDEGMGEGEGPVCDRAIMERLMAEAARPGVQLDTIEISWTDSRLGEVGGPIVPLVTVTLHQSDLPLRNFVYDDIGPLTAVSSTVVGEALGRAKTAGPQC